jgi:hypothetical protein
MMPILGEVNPQNFQLSLVTIASCFLLSACADDPNSMEGAESVDSMSSMDETADTLDTSDTDALPGTPVELGEAGDFAILAKSGISTVPPSAVTGDVGVSPAAATYLTGFSLTMDGTDTFSTSPQVTGNLYASDYAAPTPADLTAAIGDMELAFTDAAGRAPDVTELGAGNISGMTLEPGVYGWGTSLGITTDIWLDGSETDVWCKYFNAIKGRKPLSWNKQHYYRA